MAQSLVLSIDVCPGLGISPLRTNIWLSCSQPKIGPLVLFFSGFLKSFFSRRFALIASGTDIFWRVSLKFQLFMETSRFHCHRYEHRLIILLAGPFQLFFAFYTSLVLASFFSFLCRFIILATKALHTSRVVTSFERDIYIRRKYKIPGTYSEIPGTYAVHSCVWRVACGVCGLFSWSMAGFLTFSSRHLALTTNKDLSLSASHYFILPS